MEKHDPLATKLAAYLQKRDMSISQVAIFTGASRTTIYNWISGGRISPAYRRVVEQLLQRG